MSAKINNKKNGYKGIKEGFLESLRGFASLLGENSDNSTEILPDNLKKALEEEDIKGENLLNYDSSFEVNESSGRGTISPKAYVSWRKAKIAREKQEKNQDQIEKD